MQLGSLTLIGRLVDEELRHSQNLLDEGKSGATGRLHDQSLPDGRGHVEFFVLYSKLGQLFIEDRLVEVHSYGAFLGQMLIAFEREVVSHCHANIRICEQVRLLELNVALLVVVDGLLEPGPAATVVASEGRRIFDFNLGLIANGIDNWHRGVLHELNVAEAIEQATAEADVSVGRRVVKLDQLSRRLHAERKATEPVEPLLHRLALRHIRPSQHIWLLLVASPLVVNVASAFLWYLDDSVGKLARILREVVRIVVVASLFRALLPLLQAATIQELQALMQALQVVDEHLQLLTDLARARL